MESKNTVKAIKLLAAGFVLAPSLAMADSSALDALKATAGSEAAAQTTAVAVPSANQTNGTFPSFHVGESVTDADGVPARVTGIYPDGSVSLADDSGNDLGGLISSDRVGRTDKTIVIGGLHVGESVTDSIGEPARVTGIYPDGSVSLADDSGNDLGGLISSDRVGRTDKTIVIRGLYAGEAVTDADGVPARVTGVYPDGSVSLADDSGNDLGGLISSDRVGRTDKIIVIGGLHVGESVTDSIGEPARVTGIYPDGSVSLADDSGNDLGGLIKPETVGRR